MVKPSPSSFSFALVGIPVLTSQPRA
jgi:hypothetical protein